MNGITAVYVGNHYEVKNNIATKYYFAGATRIAVRTNGTLSYLLGDHIGSSSVTTDANGVQTATALYKAFGETRYTLGNLGTDYKFTGQREEAALGIYYFNARWMDPSLGRFTSPDTIVPTGTQGTQAWDRYAFVNNNPVRYTDPTGHEISWRSAADFFAGAVLVALAVAVVAAIVVVAAPVVFVAATATAVAATATTVLVDAIIVAGAAAAANQACDYFADQAESSSSSTPSSTTTTTVTVTQPDGTVINVTTNDDVTINTNSDGTTITIDGDDDER